MDTDTYSNPDAIDTQNKGYVGVRLNLWKERKLAEKYQVPGTPFSVFVTPEGEMMGRVRGYKSPNDYIDCLRRISEGYARLVTLEPKSPTQIKEAADICMDIDNIRRAMDLYERVADTTPDSDAEKKACAQSCIMLLHIVFNTSTDGSFDGNLLQRRVQKCKDLDPENAFGTLDEAMAFEALLQYNARHLAEAIKIAEDLAKRFPNSKRIDMALYVLGMAYLETEKKDEGEKILKGLVTRFPKTLYGSFARNVVEKLDNK